MKNKQKKNKPKRINPRITIKKHEEIIAALREEAMRKYSEVTLALALLRIDLAEKESVGGLWKAAYDSLRSRVNKVHVDLRYAHSNIRAGNNEIASDLLDSVRRIIYYE